MVKNCSAENLTTVNKELFSDDRSAVTYGNMMAKTDRSSNTDHVLTPPAPPRASGHVSRVKTAAFPMDAMKNWMMFNLHSWLKWNSVANRAAPVSHVASQVIMPPPRSSPSSYRRSPGVRAYPDFRMSPRTHRFTCTAGLTLKSRHAFASGGRRYGSHRGSRRLHAGAPSHGPSAYQETNYVISSCKFLNHNLLQQVLMKPFFLYFFPFASSLPSSGRIPYNFSTLKINPLSAWGKYWLIDCILQ